MPRHNGSTIRIRNNLKKRKRIQQNPAENRLSKRTEREEELKDGQGKEKLYSNGNDSNTRKLTPGKGEISAEENLPIPTDPVEAKKAAVERFKHPPTAESISKRYIENSGAHLSA